MRLHLRHLTGLVVCVSLALLSGAVAVAAVTLATPVAAHASTVDGYVSRAEAIARAQYWVGQYIPYDQNTTHADQDGAQYRTDCSGFVSMALHISPQGPSTDGLMSYVTQIAKDDLRPGDLLMTPIIWGNGGVKIVDGHVILFESWADAGHTSYNAYEFGGGTGVSHDVGMAYPHGGDARPFTPYRYNKIVDGTGQSAPHLLLTDGRVASYTVRLDLNVWGTSQAYAGGPFNAWQQFPAGGTFTGEPAALQLSDGRIFIAAHTTDGTVKVIAQTSVGGPFGSWATVPSLHLDGADPAVVQLASGVVMIFGVSGGNVWGVQTGSNGGFGSWQQLPSDGHLVGRPAVLVLASGMIAVFARNTGNQLRGTNQAFAGGPYQPWITISGAAIAGDPQMLQLANGAMTAYARGTDNNIWRNSQTSAGGGWAGWQQLSFGGGFSGNPGIVQLTSGIVAAYARTVGGFDLWGANETSPGGPFSGWISLGATTVSASPTVFQTASGAMTMYIKGPINSVWGISQAGPGGGWGQWTQI